MMTIHIEMTTQDFCEFLEWQKDKGGYKAELVGLRSKFKGVLNKIFFAVERDAKKPGRFKIADHEHAEELLEMADELLERLDE